MKLFLLTFCLLLWRLHVSPPGQCGLLSSQSSRSCIFRLGLPLFSPPMAGLTGVLPPARLQGWPHISSPLSCAVNASARPGHCLWGTTEGMGCSSAGGHLGGWEGREHREKVLEGRACDACRVVVGEASEKTGWAGWMSVSASAGCALQRGEGLGGRRQCHWSPG